MTSRTLNSHDVAAPVSPHHQEVTCYIDYNITMPSQNLWKVQLLNPDETGGVWQTIRSLVNLIHVNSTQALKFSGKQLPDWGYNQHEVVTDRVINQDDTVWNVEEHRYTKDSDEKDRERDLVRAEFVPLTPTRLNFWQKMKELQYKMIISGTNDKLLEGHMYENDSPLAWLLLYQGIAYFISPDSNSQIFLVGNFIMWIASLTSLVTLIAIFILIAMRRRRKSYDDLSEDHWIKLSLVFRVCISGYLIHFLPYFFLEKTLFLHDYLPSLIFQHLTLAALIEFSEVFVNQIYCHFTGSLMATRDQRNNKKGPESQFNHVPFRIRMIPLIITLFLICTFVYCFLHLLPLSYASGNLSAEDVKLLKWRKSWNLIVHHE